MSNITISPLIIPGWRHGNGNYKVRIPASQSFFASNGNQIAKGDQNFFEFNAVALNGFLTVEAITIPTTDDSLDYPGAVYKHAAVYKKSQKVHTIIGSFRVPESLGANTSWALIKLANGPVRRIAFDGSSYSRTEVNALFNALLETIVYDKSSTSENGVTKIDVVPDDPNNPIAVGANSPRVETVLTSFSNSLTAAVTALSITGRSVKLVIKEDTELQDNLTIPKHVQVDFQGGIIRITKDKTLLIKKFRDPGNVRCFDVEEGSTIKFDVNAVDHFNIWWWTGAPGDSNDHTAGIEQTLRSCFQSGGGEIRFPYGIWKTKGGHHLGSYFRLKGEHPDWASVYGTHIRMIDGGDEDHLFFVGSNICNLQLENMSLSAEGTTGKTLFLGAGESPNSGRAIRFVNCTFKQAEIGVCFGPADELWEVQGIAFIDCCWSLCQKAVYCNTPNSAMRFESPLIFIPEGGYGLYFKSVACVDIVNHFVLGYQSVPYAFDRTDNLYPEDDPLGHSFLYLGANRGVVNIWGGCDEGLKYFAIDENFSAVPINITGASIQCVYLFNSPNAKVNVNGCYMYSNTFRDHAGSGGRVTSRGHQINPIDISTAQTLSVASLADFDGGSIVLVEDSYDTGTTFRYKVSFIANPAFPLLPAVEVMASQVGAILARFGQSNAAGVFIAGYEISRDMFGHLNINGTQGFPFREIKTNANITAAGSIKSSVHITADGYITGELVRSASVGTRPTASADYEGAVWLVRGGPGVDSVFQVCLKKADNNYYWRNFTVSP